MWIFLDSDGLYHDMLEADGHTGPVYVYSVLHVLQEFSVNWDQETQSYLTELCQRILVCKYSDSIMLVIAKPRFNM